MGIGGDVETAARLSLPVSYVIDNNSALCAGLELGCYVENIEKPRQLTGATTGLEHDEQDQARSGGLLRVARNGR
jgi:hypothetical protein